MAIVDVQFAILSLETAWTLARVSRDQISTRGSVLAGRRIAFVDFFRTVTTRITVRTMAPVTITDVFADTAIMAQSITSDSFTQGRVITGHHFYVTHLASPTGLANTLVQILNLFARRSVFTGLWYATASTTPIYQ